VITAREARGRGHADRLLRAAIRAAAQAGYAYSLLWTHLPRLYARHGYGEAPEEALLAVVGAPPDAEGIRPAADDDLPAVAQLENRVDAHRSGPAMRDLAFWRASRDWLGDDLLVAEGARGIEGYIRSRTGPDGVDVLELGANPSDLRCSRRLLTAAAGPRQTRLRAVLPPSLGTALDPWNPTLVESSGLLGRPLALPALAAALSPLWAPRLPVAGMREVTMPIALPDTFVGLRVTADAVSLVPVPGRCAPLDPGQLTALLLRGCDDRTQRLLGDRSDFDRLAALAPSQGFVLWPADAL
jgi:hypothetical protein